MVDDGYYLVQKKAAGITFGVKLQDPKAFDVPGKSLVTNLIKIIISSCLNTNVFPLWSAPNAYNAVKADDVVLEKAPQISFGVKFQDPKSFEVPGNMLLKYAFSSCL